MSKRSIVFSVVQNSDVAPAMGIESAEIAIGSKIISFFMSELMAFGRPAAFMPATRSSSTEIISFTVSLSMNQQLITNEEAETIAIAVCKKMKKFMPGVTVVAYG